MSPATSKVLKWASFALVALGSPSDEVMAFSAPRHRTPLRGSVGRVNGISGNIGRLWMAGNDGNGGDNEDPNPGGLNQWSDDDDDKQSFEDLTSLNRYRNGSPVQKEKRM